MARGPRSALQAGLAAVLAVALVALALLAKPGDALQGDSTVRFISKSYISNPYAFDTQCVNSTLPSGTYDAEITWGIYPGQPACFNMSFYSFPSCVGVSFVSKLRPSSNTTTKWTLSQKPASVFCQV
ncbi:unnamed protein product [Closterium sp. Yama58-4]|nr:unnamed protein product [Closterium sp. Yama58-4]